MDARTRLSVCVAVAIGVACSSSQPGPTNATRSLASSTTAAVVCPDDAQLRTVIESFLAEYNVGRAGLADRFFAPEPEFQWYSERPMRLNQDAYTRSTLEDYLLKRHADGDRLTLSKLQVNGARYGIGNFGFALRRGSAELESKGAIDCATGKFIVWSIGPEAGPV